MKTQPPCIIWLMGPTSCGKTTIGRALLQRLREQDLPALHYDGDEVRDFFGPTLGFGSEDRLRVVKTLCHLANKSRQAGVWVIVSALTAHQQAREMVLSEVENLFIVSISCSIEECCERDPKGLYRQAKEGKINTLIGFNTRYDPPAEYDIELDSQANGPAALVEQLMHVLAANPPRRNATR